MRLLPTTGGMGLRLGLVWILLGFSACSNEPPATVSIEARIIDNGTASDYQLLGSVGRGFVERVGLASFALQERPAGQAVVFGPGCFALQLARDDVAVRSEDTLLVAASRSVYSQQRGIPSSATIIPLLAPRYDFTSLGSLTSDVSLLDLDLDGFEAKALGASKGENGNIRLDCTVDDVASAPLSVAVTGAGLVRIGDDAGRACSVADERACHTSLPDSPSAETTLFLELLPGAQTDIETTLITGCPEIARRPEARGDGVLPVRVEPGRCSVAFGEPAWLVRIDTVADEADPFTIAPDTEKRAPVTAIGGNRWLVPDTLNSLLFKVTNRSGQPAAFDVRARTGCFFAGLGQLGVERSTKDIDSVDCTILPQGVDRQVSLNLGDSNVGVRLEPLDTNELPIIECKLSEDEPAKFGPCRDPAGNLVGESEADTEVLFPKGENVRLTSLVRGAEFVGCGEETILPAEGFPYVELTMNEDRACVVAQADTSSTFPVLEVYLPRTVGSIRVSEPTSGYEQLVAGMGRLIRLEQVPFAPLTVELLPAGYPSEAFSLPDALVPLSDSRTGDIEADANFRLPGVKLQEVPCDLGDFLGSVPGQADTYLLDVPGLVDAQSKATSRSARVTCAALFECSESASFEPLIDMTVRDNTGLEFTATFDCAGDTCSLVDPDPASTNDGVDGVQIFLPSPVTLGLQASVDVDGRALDAFVASPVPDGRALEKVPRVQLSGSSMAAIELGVETELPETFTPQVSDVFITARLRVCRDSILEDLVLSAVARRRP